MKKLLSLLLLLFSVSLLWAQQDNDVPLPKSYRDNTKERKTSNRPRLMSGGNFGLQFGTHTAVSISPVIGIYPTDWLLVGVGGSYMYSYDNYYKLSSHVFGFTAFVQGLVFKQRLILYAGYEYVNYDYFYQHYTGGQIYKKRNDSHGLFLGPGYRQPISDNFAIYGLLLFDVIQTYDSFYGNPIIRMGVVYDF
ncbi:MAG: hypothetical protein LBV02_06310 [Bacteroidales bacterium]|jgi:hypothetical protein|nr:hypothetical protein [Bacteroidales bacterium]